MLLYPALECCCIQHWSDVLSLVSERSLLFTADHFNSLPSRVGLDSIDPNLSSHKGYHANRRRRPSGIESEFLVTWQPTSCHLNWKQIHGKSELSATMQLWFTVSTLTGNNIVCCSQKEMHLTGHGMSLEQYCGLYW